MYSRLLFCLIVLIGFTVNAQTINVRGKISNQAGIGIPNAIISLAVQGLKDTSGTDGSYAITKGDVAVSAFSIPRTQAINLNGDFLEFSLPEPSPVKVEIFDLKGKLLKKEVLQNASIGFYRFNIMENFRAAKLLLIKASIGDKMETFRYLPLKNSKNMVNSPVESSIPVGGKLSKITAINDTLKVTVSGYNSKLVKISSYDTTVNISLDSAGNGDVTVQLDQTRQVIDGFGINNVWSGGWSDPEADQLFDSTKGLGLTILRIGMDTAGNQYNGSSCWNDIKKAKARGLKYVIGSTWTPPARMKTNNNESDGGYLKPEYYSQWADRIAAFPGKVKSGSGSDLYAMSIGNEPDFASCGMNEPCNGNYATTLYNDTQIVNFIKVVGPKLRNAGCKVMAPEASEWLHIWSDSSVCCSINGKRSSDPLKGKGYDYGHTLYKDKAAWAQLDILGVHQYDSQIAEPWPSDVPEKKNVWQTEMSGVKWWPDGVPNVDINNGVAVAGWIHNALTVGEANGWCYWWWKAGGDTNEGLLLKDGTDTKRHYTFGNFTKYVRPGMTRVDITGKIPANVLLTAFKGAGNKVVVVAINKGTTAATVPITIAGGTAPASMTPIVTASSENWASKTDVPVSGGTFTATLAGMTVTTFVSK